MNQRNGSVQGGRSRRLRLPAQWRRRVRWLMVTTAVFGIAEVAVFVVVAAQVGVVAAIAALVLTSLLGARLAASRSGRRWREVRLDLLLGRNPNADAVHAALLAGAGILLAVPGFLSDVLGLALLLPSVRRGAARRLPALLRARETFPPSPRPSATRPSETEGIRKAGAKSELPSTTTVTWGKPLPRE